MSNKSDMTLAGYMDSPAMWHNSVGEPELRPFGTRHSCTVHNAVVLNTEKDIHCEVRSDRLPNTDDQHWRYFLIGKAKYSY